MYERFCELLDKKGLKPIDVSKATGLSSTVFSEWKKGKSAPNAHKLLKIARFLNVSMEYLITGEESERPSSIEDSLTDIQREAWALIKKMDDKTLRKFITIGRTILE